MENIVIESACKKIPTQTPCHEYAKPAATSKLHTVIK